VAGEIAALLGSFRAVAPAFAAALLGSCRAAAPVAKATLSGLAALAAPISAAAMFDSAALLAPALAALLGSALVFATAALLPGFTLAAAPAFGAALLLGIAAPRELRSGDELLNLAADGPAPTAGLAFDAGLGVSAATPLIPRQPTAARMAS
jgi:hypothetical protein